MKLRNMAVSTRKIYVSSVANFSAYHGRFSEPGQVPCPARECWVGFILKPIS